jgi:hypothetical protein
MNATRDELDSPEELQGFVRQLAQVRGSSDVVEAVRRYLDTWPAERIARIQRIDAGWAPFDLQQHPSPPLGPADLRKIRDAVHGQCAALASAGVYVEEDLLELEASLTLACRILDDLPAACETPRHA